MKSELQFNLRETEDFFRLNDEIPDLPARIKNNIPEALQYGCFFWMSHFELSRSEESNKRVLNFQPVLFWVEALSLLDTVHWQSHGGEWLVSGSDDKTLRLWDIASGTMLG